MNEGNLLLDREPRQQVIDPRLERLRRVAVERAFLHLSGNRQQGESERRLGEN
jgi:hypothetical protein